MLGIENLSVKLGRKKILDNFSCTFAPGVHGLLGPNGAGKTTLMRCILGLYPQKKGGITVDGDKVQAVKAGYLPQKFGLFPGMTVREGLRYLGNARKIPKEELEQSIESVIEEVNLTDKIDKKISSLSGGMVRRLGIAQAFLGKPDILIFDEPTAGLDPEERLRFKNFVKKNKEGRTIIISTHIVSDVENLCDHVEIIDQGVLKKQGSCDEIREFAKGKVYGIPETEFPETPGTCFVQEEYEEGHKKMLRVLMPEGAPYETLPAEFEDGYLCILKGIL